MHRPDPPPDPPRATLPPATAGRPGPGPLLRLAALGTVALALASAPSRAEDWLRWGGPNGDFTVPARGLAEDWPLAGPPQLWKRPLGKGYSSILHRDGRLFTMFRDGDDEVVVSLDAATGATRWEQRESPRPWPDMTEHFGRGPNSTPLLAAGRLVAIGIAGHLRCLDAATGEPLWERDLPAAFGRRQRVEEYGYSGNPLPWGDHVIVLVGGEEHAVVAFDPRDGSMPWKSAPGGVSYAQPVITRLAGRDQYVYFSPEGVEALDPATGEKLWSFPIELTNGNHLTPVVPCDDRHLWVGSQFDSGGGRLLELVGEAGALAAEQRWFDSKLQSSHWTMIRRGDLVYGSIGSNRLSLLTAFDWQTGEVAWKKRGYHKAQALFADDKLLFLDERGQLVLGRVSPEGFEVLARARVTGAVSWSLPTLVGTTLYLRDQEHVLALDLAAASDGD